MIENLNGFVELSPNALYDIDGGIPFVVGLIIAVVVVCAVVFFVSVGVSAYNQYKEMERMYG